MITIFTKKLPKQSTQNILANWMINNNILSSLLSYTDSSSSPPLGRWDPKRSSNVKSFLANIDSCGDTLCGYPDAYRTLIEQEVELDRKMDDEKYQPSKSVKTRR